MKKILAIASFVCMMNGLYAQQHTEIELIRDAYKLEKKAVVANYLKLSNDDAAKFWPIYQKYEAERTLIGDRKVKLITQYVNDHHVGNAANADSMVKASADIQKKEVDLRVKYYTSMKAISPAVAINFFQIEDIIATTIKLKLWEELAH